MKFLTVILLLVYLLVIVKSKTHQGCSSIVEFNNDKTLSAPEFFINIKNISKYGGVNLRVSISIPNFIPVSNYTDSIILVDKSESQVKPFDKSVSLKFKFSFPPNIYAILIGIAVNQEIYECRDDEEYERVLNYQYYLPLERDPQDTVLNEICSRPMDLENITNFNTKSDPQQWPWLALIFLRTNDTREHVCSGSFITNRHVLTTASCILLNNPEKLEIGYRIAELIETDYENNTAVYYEIKDYRIHPDYESTSTANIAVIEIIDEDVETRTVDPVCVCSPQIADELYMTDWNEQNQFQQLKFVVNETDDCLKLYSNDQSNNESDVSNNAGLFCATVIDKNTSYYNYYSKQGNGLVAYDSESDEYYLQGILTQFFDIYSADGIFINLEEYYTWIKNVTIMM